MTRIDAKEDLNGQAFPCTRTRRLLPENKERKLHDIRADSRNSEIPWSKQPRRFGEAGHDIEALDGLAAGALDDVVQRAHDDEPAGAGVEPPRDLNHVRADDILDVGQRFAVEQADKRFIAEGGRSEEHTSELQSHSDLVCRLLLEKK